MINIATAKLKYDALKHQDSTTRNKNIAKFAALLIAKRFKMITSHFSYSNQ